MADNPPEYELVPYQEIDELKKELQRLKEFPIPTSKKLLLAVEDLSTKISRLINIFEEAEGHIHKEDGGLSFKERIKPVNDKMNKVIEQNAEIAKGILALADLINQKYMNRQRPAQGMPPQMPPGGLKPMPPQRPPMGGLPQPPGLPPPPPKKKRRFL